MTIALVPDTRELADVLPTDRLLSNGMAIPELRKQFRHIDNWRNVRAITMVWVWTALLAYVLLRYLSYLSKWSHSFTRLFTILRK